jgi:hypothetical protein
MIEENTGISSVVCTSSNHSFRLSSLATPTGIKFIITSDVDQSNRSDILSRVYVAYADWVMKNINYTPEMPIRIPAFDTALMWISKTNAMGRL